MTASDGQTHFSSVVVQTSPERLDEVADSIGRLAHAEVNSTDPDGKLVALFETPSLYQVTERIDEISRMPGVITATLVFHQIEDNQLLDEQIDLPPALQDLDIKEHCL